MTRTLSRRDVLARGAGAALAAPLLGATASAVSAAPDAPAGDPKKLLPVSLNTSTLRGQKLAITELVDIAAKAGYAGIEPWPDEIERYVQSGASLADLRKRIEDGGLKVTGAIAFFHWMVDDDAERARALEEAKVLMDRLDRIGATHVAAPPAGKVDGIDLLTAAERYRALLEVSEQFSVVPAVEIWGFRDNLNRLGQAVMVALEAQHPRACVLPDVYHLYKGGSGLDGVGLLGGKILGGFHFNDYPSDPPRETIRDQHRVYPGDGVAPLEKLFRDLWATGYRGAISIELFNPDYWKEEPLKVAREALEKTRRVMERALG